MQPARLLATLLFVFSFTLVAPQTVSAGPAGGSASGQVSTSGARGSSSGSGYDWPERVVGGNAISFIAPLQIGIVNYLPKARFGFQYDRQLRKAHWIYAGVAILADRGGWQNFRMDSCGLEGATGINPPERCGRGGVVGVDLYAGYAHKWYIREHPYIVPIARGAVGWSWWALPQVGGGDSNREQSRTRSWTLNLRPGGGVRLFLLDELALGFDINLPIGFLVHTDRPRDTDERNREAGFLLGIEILPLILEYRF
jgi:hypothetical protein